MVKNRQYFSIEDANQFNRLHNEHELSLRKIASIYNTSHNTIKNTLIKYGYPYRQRRYPLNENFFRNITTLEKQYFLGWLYSDGCMFSYEKKQYYGFSIKIQKRDKYILEYLNRLLDSTSNVTPDYTNGKEYSRLKIGSKKIFNDLLKYGLFPRKTHVLKYPKNIITEPRAFILGVFEGDGSISIKKK